MAAAYRQGVMMASCAAQLSSALDPEGAGISMDRTLTAKNRSLDGLRALACINVFFAHYLGVFAPYPGHNQAPGQPPSTAPAAWQEIASHPPWTLLFNGQYPVIIFFVLSSYVLMRKYWQTGDRSGLVSGLLKRYPRLILPSAVAGLIIYAMWKLGAMHTQAHPSDQMPGWVASVYATPMGFGDALWVSLVGNPFFLDVRLNGVTWTLTVEMWGSLALFGLFIVARSWRWLPVVVLLVVPIFLPALLLAIPFALGVVLCAMEGWLKRHSRVAATMVLAGLVIGGFDYSPAYAMLQAIPLPNFYPGIDFNVDKRTSWCIVASVLTVAGVIGSRSFDVVLAAKPLVRLGDISFSFYLWHWPIMLSFSMWAVDTLVRRGHPYDSAILWVALPTALISIAVSIVFTKIVDRPSIHISDAIGRWVASKDWLRLDRLATPPVLSEP